MSASVPTAPGSPAIRLGITLAGPLADADVVSRLPGLAREAEAAGIDVLAVPDHLALGANPAHYPYGAPMPSARPYTEPLALLAAASAVTSRLRLMTNVLVVPLRPAILLAKMCATLDLLSGGRLVLGAGTGWHEPEFDAAGVPFDGRGARMDDALRSCRVLWRDAPATFSSSTVSFDEMWSEPRPLGADSIGILVGGGNVPRTIARVLDYADGWMPPPSLAPAEVADAVEQIRAALRGAGGDPFRLEVVQALPMVEGGIERTLEAGVPARIEAGVTVMQVPVGDYVRSADEVPRFLERLATRFAAYRT